MQQAAAKPGVTDVGAQLPALKEQTEPLLPSGKHSSPVTGYVPAGVLGQKDDIEQVREGLSGIVRSGYECLEERERLRVVMFIMGLHDVSRDNVGPASLQSCAVALSVQWL